MWPPSTNMNGERMPLPNKLIAVSIDKDRGSQVAFKWTVDHLLARGQTVLLIHVKVKQSSNSSGQSSQTTCLDLGYPMEYLPPPTETESNKVSDESGSGNTQLDPQTKELFLPFRLFCMRKDIQCYDVVLDDTDVAKAVVEYVNLTGVEVLVVGASTRGGLLRFKATDIPGGMLKNAPDFCTVHIISKSREISSTRAASRSAPFVHPLRHQLMQPPSTKFASFDSSTPSTDSRSESKTKEKTSHFIKHCLDKLIAVSIDKDKGSRVALKWTIDHLLARGQTVLLIHVKVKQSSNSSESNKVSDESGSGNTQLDPQTKELFLPFRLFCMRKDIQCYDVVLDDTDVAKAVVEYVNLTGVEVLVVGASTRGGLLRFKAKDITGGMLKNAPDFCTVHVISKSGNISSTRAASRSAPFVHPLRHQLMQPPSTKLASFDSSTPSTNSRSESKTKEKTSHFIKHCLDKLIAVSIDKDKGSRVALKWTIDHLLARGQTVLLIHVKVKQSSNSSESNKVSDESGSGNTQLDPQTKELFLPFRLFCMRKDIQCYDVVLDDTDVAKAVVEYVNLTGVEVLVVGASTRGGLLRFKATDIPGGMSKNAPDFCTVHIISKSREISSTRAASRSAPFVHPLRHQLMQPPSTKFASFDSSTPSTDSRSESKTKEKTIHGGTY